MIVKNEIRTLNTVRITLIHFDVLKLDQKNEEKEV